MTDLHYLSATEALARFRARELSPVELLDAVIARAEEVEPTVNALCHTFYDEAREQAREAEARYMGRGETPRPLEGIPTAIKEEEAVAGQPWTQGSLIYKDLVAEESSVFAQRILDSGAVVHARSTAPEFSCAAFTHSRIHGVTRNPWNPEFAVGGSSGGSGASLASGTSTLASGSDIGGSIRIPASFNGVVGFKPPYGRVPQAAPFNLDVYCHCGPMARTVADCALFENQLAGPHPRDHVSLRPKLEIPAEMGGVDGLRVAVSADLGGWPVDPEIAANTVDAAMALREAGAVVDEVDLDIPRELVDRATAIHFALIFAEYVEEAHRAHGELMTDYAIEFARQSNEDAIGSTMLEELELEARLWVPVGELLERYDVLISPTVHTRGLVAGEGYVGRGIEVGGVDLPFYFDSIPTPVFNIMSRCPVLAVPSGFGNNGVPTGIQIAARTYDDVTAFRVGAALERLRPWLDRPERQPAIAAGAA
jgi:Asp-tRNA(Asn)/Glu-tRNA(Gln) amidotransferase A subunit family amidase